MRKKTLSVHTPSKFIPHNHPGRVRKIAAHRMERRKIRVTLRKVDLFNDEID